MTSVLKNKSILAGIFMIIFYQAAMIGIFMPGYSSIPKNIPSLSIAVVNEDSQYGARFAEQLKEKLPFRLIEDLSLEEAKARLDNRELHLIVHIPDNFTASLSEQGQQAQLDYYMNGSNPATITSTMQTVANQISDSINDQIVEQSLNGLLQNLQLPEEQAKAAIEGIMSKLTFNTEVSNVIPTGTHNQMAPLFLTLGCYVGAMIYSMLSIGALNQLKGSLGKWRAFLGLQAINVGISLTASVVGLAIYFAIQSYSLETFLHVWMLQALELFTAISFTSIFCLLAGQVGMLINMPLLLAQTIASGAVVSREMMPGFFEALSYISPMYYNVHANLNLLFGGGATGNYVAGLALIGVGALVLNAIIHALKAVRASDQQKEGLTVSGFM